MWEPGQTSQSGPAVSPNARRNHVVGVEQTGKENSEGKEKQSENQAVATAERLARIQGKEEALHQEKEVNYKQTRIPGKRCHSTGLTSNRKRES